MKQFYALYLSALITLFPMEQRASTTTEPNNAAGALLLAVLIGGAANVAYQWYRVKVFKNYLQQTPNLDCSFAPSRVSIPQEIADLVHSYECPFFECANAVSMKKTRELLISMALQLKDSLGADVTTLYGDSHLRRIIGKKHTYSMQVRYATELEKLAEPDPETVGKGCRLTLTVTPRTWRKPCKKIEYKIAFI